MGLRDTLDEHPAIARIAAGAIALLAVGFLARSFFKTAPDSIERRSQTVTIRDTLTGDEWQMNRGQFERLLMTQDGMLDPNAGIPSQFSDGKPVGVLVDKDDWEETVERINTLKREYSGSGRSAP